MTLLLLRWVILTVAIAVGGYVTQIFVPGFTVEADGIIGVFRLMLGAAVFGLLNATLGRILKLLFIPVRCLTLGLMTLVINAVIFYLAGSFALGFEVTSFWAALLGSIFVSVTNGILGLLLPDKDSD